MSEEDSQDVESYYADWNESELIDAAEALEKAIQSETKSDVEDSGAEIDGPRTVSTTGEWAENRKKQSRKKLKPGRTVTTGTLKHVTSDNNPRSPTLVSEKWAEESAPYDYYRRGEKQDYDRSLVYGYVLTDKIKKQVDGFLKQMRDSTHGQKAKNIGYALSKHFNAKCGYKFTEPILLIYHFCGKYTDTSFHISMQNLDKAEWRGESIRIKESMEQYIQCEHKRAYAKD